MTIESNKDEAYRAMKVAEKKWEAGDLAGAKKLAVKGQEMYPSLEGVAHMIAVLDVHMAAQNRVNGLPDWYAILQVDLATEEVVIKKHFRKLALLLHPDKNKFPGAEEAFKLIGEASRVLCDKTQRVLYDQTRNFKHKQTKPRKPRAQNNNAHAQSNVYANTFKAQNSNAYAQPNGYANAFKAFSANTTGFVPTFFTKCTGATCGVALEFPIHHMDSFVPCPMCLKPFMARGVIKDPFSGRGGFGKENENESDFDVPPMAKAQKHTKAKVPNNKEKEKEKGKKAPNDEEKEKEKEKEKNSSSNHTQNEELNTDRKETEVPKKSQARKTTARKRDAKFDLSAFDRLFAGSAAAGMKMASKEDVQCNKRAKLEAVRASIPG